MRWARSSPPRPSTAHSGNLNLVPKLYGAESDFTDVDINILPDSVYAGYPQGARRQSAFVPYPCHPATVLQTSESAPRWLNGLGVGSYDDGIIDDGGKVDGVPYVQSQKYSIWRILSRGPVPQSVLNSYLPTKVAQPAVSDTQSPIPPIRTSRRRRFWMPIAA